MPIQYCASCGGATKYIENKPNNCSKCGKPFSETFDLFKSLAASSIGGGDETKTSAAPKALKTIHANLSNPYKNKRFSLAELGVHIVKEPKNIIGREYGFGGTSVEDDTENDTVDSVSDNVNNEPDSAADETSDELSPMDAEQQIVMALAESRARREAKSAMLDQTVAQSIPSQAVLKEGNGTFVPRRFDVSARRAQLAPQTVTEELKPTHVAQASESKTSKSKKICRKSSRRSKTK